MEIVEEEPEEEEEKASAGAEVPADGAVVEEAGEAAAEESVDVEEYECPECGAKINPSMTTCPNCGVGLSFEYEEE